MEFEKALTHSTLAWPDSMPSRPIDANRLRADLLVNLVLRCHIELLLYRCDFRIRHKGLPEQARAVVFHHRDNRCLIEPHVYGRDPRRTRSRSIGIARPVDAPKIATQIPIVVLKGFHRGFRRVREGSQGTRQSYGSV